MANGRSGAEAADDQVELLEAQRERLAAEAELLEVRRRYVQIKIDFWHAVNAGDETQSELLGAEARAPADQLTRGRKKPTG